MELLISRGREEEKKKKKSRENWMQIEDRNPIMRINEILILISRKESVLYFRLDVAYLKFATHTRYYVLKSIAGAINQFSSRNRIIRTVV